MFLRPGLAQLVRFFSPPSPLKNDGRIVSWDDFPFPTEWEVIKFMFQTTKRLKGLVTTLLRKLHKGGSRHIS